MLDRQSTAVLNIINSISNGAYKIIDADEIISRLSETEKATKLELAGIIRSLTDHELVKVKYSTVEEYCLAALPKARLVEERIKVGAPEEEQEEAPTIVEVKPDLDFSKLKRIVRRAAFFGALVGGCIAAVLAFVFDHYILK
jgi:hypothetical protein